MTALDWPAVCDVLDEVGNERGLQHEKFGTQSLPDGTGQPYTAVVADAARRRCQRAFADGEGTWADVLREEFCEAFAESDPALLRAELIQVAAVAVAWIEAIDTRPISYLPTERPAQ